MLYLHNTSHSAQHDLRLESARGFLIISCRLHKVQIEQLLLWVCAPLAGHKRSLTSLAGGGHLQTVIGYSPTTTAGVLLLAYVFVRALPVWRQFLHNIPLSRYTH